MLKELDHIGIAVSDLQEVIETLRRGFELEPAFIEQVADQKVRIAGYRIGNSVIEYFEPSETGTAVSRYLDKRGNGIHHIALRVDNLEEKLKELSSKGFELIDTTPRQGADGKKIAFLHPRAFNGILIELSEQ